MLPSTRNRNRRRTRRRDGNEGSFVGSLARVGGAALAVCLLIYLQLAFLKKPSHVINITVASALFPLSDFQESLSVFHLGPGFWERMRPAFNCPPPLLKREGGRPTKHVGDGAKWICDIPHLATRPSCLIYSFGVDEDLSFEGKIMEAAPRCHVYAYDPTVYAVAPPLRADDPRVHFRRLGLGGKDEKEYRTLKTLMRDNGGHRWIDLLKVDVDGAEYEALDRILKDFQDLPFGRLNVELHLGTWSPKTSQAQVVELIQRLEAGGLRLFHVEKNMIGVPENCCAELAFVNVKQLDKVVDLSKKKKSDFENDQ